MTSSHVGHSTSVDLAKTYTSMDQIEQELFPAVYAARQRKCPACGAAPGAPCIAWRERMALRDPHPARIDAGRVAPAQGQKDSLGGDA